MENNTPCYKQRLQSFYDDVIMDVVHHYFESKILGNKSFQSFLEENLHILFHKREPRKRCCECSKTLLTDLRRRPELEKYQFDLLYECDDSNLATKEHTHADESEECLKRYTPNTETVSEGVVTMDICLVCILIKCCCLPGTFPGDPRVLEDIKHCRHFISHLGNQFSENVQPKLEENWKLLESSVLDIAKTLGKAYEHGLKRRISSFASRNASIKDFSSSVVEEFVRAFIGHKEHVGNISFEFVSTEIKTNLTQAGKEREKVEDARKYRVYWKFEDPPGQWEIERMRKKLSCLPVISDFVVDCVYVGSLIVVTTTTLSIFQNTKTYQAIIKDFLTQFVKVTELDSSKKTIVDVVVKIDLATTESSVREIDTENYKPLHYSYDDVLEEPNLFSLDDYYKRHRRLTMTADQRYKKEQLGHRIKPRMDKVMDDFPIKDYYYRHRVRPQRNMIADPRYGEKERLLYSCQQRMGNVHSGKHPLNIAVIGRPGGGKSSFLNSVFASFNMDTWRQIAQHGYFGDGHLQVTSRFISYPKAAYYRSHDNSLMPTFLDMTGFEDESSEINRAVLQFVFCGRIRDYESILEARQYAYVHGASGLLKNYNKNVNKYPVDRIIVVCSPRVPLPTSFLDDVIVVAKEMKDIPVYGVLTHRDEFAPDEIPDFIKSFRVKLGLPLNRFAFIKNYCGAVDPEMIHLDTCIPSLDVPILRFMMQVLSPVQRDRLIGTDWFMIVAFVVVMLACLLFFIGKK